MAKKKQVPRRQKHIPQRTCVACRQKFDKRRLTRIVHTVDEGVVVDPTGKQNGRGAYLCDQPACWDKVLCNTLILSNALHAEISEVEKEAIASSKPAVSGGNAIV